MLFFFLLVHHHDTKEHLEQIEVNFKERLLVHKKRQIYNNKITLRLIIFLKPVKFDITLMVLIYYGYQITIGISFAKSLVLNNRFRLGILNLRTTYFYLHCYYVYLYVHILHMTCPLDL